MNKVKKCAALLSLIFFTGCSSTEILTGTKQYTSTTQQTVFSYTGTQWADTLEIQDLQYSNGYVTSKITNLTGHEVSAGITIRWECNGSIGKDTVFIHLDAEESSELQYVNYALDTPGDTYRILRVESVEIGDWEDLPEYIQNESEPSDLYSALNSCESKIRSILGF